MSAALARRQAWLLNAITEPEAPKRLGSVLGGAAVPSAIGLEVYRHAYRARLRDCLADDFSAVQFLLGAAAFAELADRFIADVPPHESTLNGYGAGFPDWLRTADDVRQRRRLLDLARLEWALVEAIHAPRGARLTVAALGRIAPDAWATTRLVPTPTLRLIRCTYAANADYEAYRAQRAIPAAVRRSNVVLVLRTARGLRRLSLEPAEGKLLIRLASGISLGRALAGVAPDDAGHIQSYFTRWLAEGLFAAAVSTATVFTATGSTATVSAE
jgi:hypothetical protein